MKKLLLPLFVLTQFIFADPPNWEHNPGDYEYAMYMGVVVTNNNGNNVSSEIDMLAAFGEDGTVRGLGIPLIVPFGPYEGQIIWELIIMGDTHGEYIDFEYYDASVDQVLSNPEEWTFSADTVEGGIINPVLFTFVEECADDNELLMNIMGMDCGMVIGMMVGCDFELAGIQLYDLCPETCDTCDDCPSDTYDCNGNCDGDAVIDECGVCDGFGAVYECGCSDAVENYDCDGNCAVEIDCTGTCGGDAVVDECGVCDGDGIVDGTCDCDGNTLDGCGVCGGNADGSDCNNDGVDDVCEDEYDIGFDTGFFEGQSTGDVNHDGDLTVTDIIIIIDNILNN